MIQLIMKRTPIRYLLVLFILCMAFVPPVQVSVFNLEDIPREVRQSAEAGDSESLYQMGCLLFDNAFCREDVNAHLVEDEEALALAMRYLEMAAMNGHPEANALLGDLYSGSFNLIRADTRKSIFFYKNAIDAGHMESFSKLASIYYVHNEFKKAMDTCRAGLKKKDNAHKKEIFRVLSYIYENGKSGYADIKKAYACNKIILLLDPKAFVVDIISKEMTDEEKKDAEKIVTLWKETQIFRID